MKATINTTNSVMDLPEKELIPVLESFLTNLDDYQQMAGDKGNEELASEFTDSYSELEKIYFSLKQGVKLDISERNSIRLLMKHTNKRAIMEFYKN